MRETALSWRRRADADLTTDRENATPSGWQSPAPPQAYTILKRKSPAKEGFPKLPTIDERAGDTTSTVGDTPSLASKPQLPTDRQPQSRSPEPQPPTNSQPSRSPLFSKVVAPPAANKVELVSSTTSAPTPTHFEASTIRPRGIQYRFSNRDRSTSSSSVTPPAANPTSAAMSQNSYGFNAPGAAGRDAFDSLDWDPESPYGNATDDSPGPVSTQPKPVTYTTVGSLVDPNAKPHFTAPNRLQRDGGGRQAYMSMGQRGQYEHSQSSRGSGSPLPLQMANSMAYAQQIGRSPRMGSMSNEGAYQASSSFSGNAPSHEMPHPRNRDLLAMGELKYSHELSSNPGTTPQASTPSSSSRLSARAPAFNTSLPMENDQQSTSGIENGQLSTSAMAFANGWTTAQQQALTEDNAYTRLQPLNNMTRSEPLSESALASLLNSPEDQFNVDGQQAYQLAPPGLQSRPTTLPNPLLGPPTPESMADLNAQPGYPHPLTAGPPGWRQHIERLLARSATAASQPSTRYRGDTSYRAPNDNARNPRTPSVWDNALPVPPTNVYDDRAQFNNLPKGYAVPRKPDSRFRDFRGPPATSDTLPPALVTRYYPYGIPSNMTGAFTLLSEATQKKIDGLTLTAEEKEAQKKKELEDWFYGGQRRLTTMGVEDYVNELADRQRASVSRFGPVGPAVKDFPSGPVITKPLTEEESNNMTTAEAAKPFVNAAFGTLLSYAEEGPNSRKSLSGFTSTSNSQIDSSEQGNQSYFGQGEGTPLKRFGSGSSRRG